MQTRQVFAETVTYIVVNKLKMFVREERLSFPMLPCMLLMNIYKHDTCTYSGHLNYYNGLFGWDFCPFLLQ